MRLIFGMHILLLGWAFAGCKSDKSHHNEHVVTENGSGDNTNREIMLTNTQIRLANITTRRVSSRPIGQTIAINGRLVVDERNSGVISSRIGGRIDKLFVKETGRSIRKGQPLYTLYSEDLVTLQQEYLLAKEQYEVMGANEKRYLSFVEAAERKLLLYGLTKKQIDQLSRSSLTPHTTFVAPASGIITEINTSEGQYVTEGGLLYRIEDIGSLWVEADLYPSETSLIGMGDRIQVSIPGSQTYIEAQVSYLSPEIRNNTQVIVLRASIENSNDLFKPGQHVQVLMTHSARHAIAVPVDAVIRDEHGTHLYVQAGENTFQPRRVETGIESFDQVEITDGLSEGDTVVATGAYLLYSEIKLRQGSDPMADHKH